MRAASGGCISVGTKREHICEAAVEPHDNFPQGLENLQAIEQQLERELEGIAGRRRAVCGLRVDDRARGIVVGDGRLHRVRRVREGDRADEDVPG